jgi:hypothetical protein
VASLGGFPQTFGVHPHLVLAKFSCNKGHRLPGGYFFLQTFEKKFIMFFYFLGPEPKALCEIQVSSLVVVCRMSCV